MTRALALLSCVLAMPVFARPFGWSEGFPPDSRFAATIVRNDGKDKGTKPWARLVVTDIASGNQMDVQEFTGGPYFELVEQAHDAAAAKAKALGFAQWIHGKARPDVRLRAKKTTESCNAEFDLNWTDVTLSIGKKELGTSRLCVASRPQLGLVFARDGLATAMILTKKPGPSGGASDVEVMVVSIR